MIMHVCINRDSYNYEKYTFLKKEKQFYNNILEML